MPDSEFINRPLKGIRIGLSASEGMDLGDYGLTLNDFSLITVELCRRLVALGAEIVLGHQWRPKGIMEAVTRFAQTYQWEAGSKDSPIIHNFLAWPDRAALSEADREQLQQLVHIDESKHQPHVTGMGARPAALYDMRQRMTSFCDARIFLSGKMEQPQPDYVSGLLEEAGLMLEQNKPIYVSGMLGGMAQIMGNIMLGGESVHFSGFGDDRRAGPYLDFLRKGPDFMTRLCGLDGQDLSALSGAGNLDTVIELTTKGLKQIHRRS